MKVVGSYTGFAFVQGVISAERLMVPLPVTAVFVLQPVRVTCIALVDCGLSETPEQPPVKVVPDEVAVGVACIGVFAVMLGTTTVPPAAV